MRALDPVEVLILDDFALQVMDPTETSDFYELIVERHQRSSTIMTSNRDPSEWIAVMSDPLLARATSSTTGKPLIRCRVRVPATCARFAARPSEITGEVVMSPAGAS